MSCDSVFPRWCSSLLYIFPSHLTNLWLYPSPHDLGLRRPGRRSWSSLLDRHCRRTGTFLPRSRRQQPCLGRSHLLPHCLGPAEIQARTVLYRTMVGTDCLDGDRILGVRHSALYVSC